MSSSKDTESLRYAFIVGMPRSGTTLLGATIARNPLAVSGPETHFFSKLSRRKRLLCMMDPFWPHLAVKCLTSLSLAGEKVCDLYGSSASTIYNYLKLAARSEKNMLDALIGTASMLSSENLVVEKTPNHLLHVDEIRKTIPVCKIIRIVRDPRASALSMTKLPWACDDPVENARLISSWYRKSKKFFERRDANSITISYEAWMSSQDFTVKQLSDFLDIPFDQRMLETSHSDSSLIGKNESWKHKIMSDIDKSLAYKWKDILSKRESEQIISICKEFGDEFGYTV